MELSRYGVVQSAPALAQWISIAKWALEATKAYALINSLVLFFCNFILFFNKHTHSKKTRKKLNIHYNTLLRFTILIQSHFLYYIFIISTQCHPHPTPLWTRFQYFNFTVQATLCILRNTWILLWHIPFPFSQDIF